RTGCIGGGHRPRERRQIRRLPTRNPVRDERAVMRETLTVLRRVTPLFVLRCEHAVRGPCDRDQHVIGGPDRPGPENERERDVNRLAYPSERSAWLESAIRRSPAANDRSPAEITGLHAETRVGHGLEKQQPREAVDCTRKTKRHAVRMPAPFAER